LEVLTNGKIRFFFTAIQKSRRTFKVFVTIEQQLTLIITERVKLLITATIKSGEAAFACNSKVTIVFFSIAVYLSK